MVAVDLAEVYGTSVRALNQAVSRNSNRFPDDFMFVLTEMETMDLRSQNVTANVVSTKARYATIVFTHAGANALSGVLKTPVAAGMSVAVHRAFAAMEQKALDDVTFLLAKLQSETTRRKPTRVQVIDGVRAGFDFETIQRMGSTSKPKLAMVARECLALGLIAALPSGTPAIPTLRPRDNQMPLPLDA